VINFAIIQADRLPMMPCKYQSYNYIEKINSDFMHILYTTRRRDSAVGIAIGYPLDDQGVEFESWWWQEFSLPHVVQTGSRTHPVSYPMGTGGSFPRGKVDHSPPTNAEVKKTWCVHPLPHTPSWRSA
jgi:hypothetical protein